MILAYKLISVQAMLHQTSQVPVHCPADSQSLSEAQSLTVLAEGKRMSVDEAIIGQNPLDHQADLRPMRSMTGGKVGAEPLSVIRNAV
jgi:hypothetical protein